MTQGICFFAYNNNQLDYTRLALLAAKHAKHHLDKPVALITNEGSWDWLKSTRSIKDIRKYIDEIVITDDELNTNNRKHWDSPWHEFSAPFYNSNKHKIWEYTPWDETLLLDTDYIVQTDFLNGCFNRDGVNMFNRALTLRNTLPAAREQRLFDAGVDMWWSTVVYFSQKGVAPEFFELWHHITDNYNYYQYLYNFPGQLYRTDYCVSIAAHILNGMQTGDVIDNMWGLPLHNMDQKDDLLDVAHDSWLMLAHNPEKNWENIAVKWNNCDIHCMNKRAIDRNWDKLWNTNTPL